MSIREREVTALAREVLAQPVLSRSAEEMVAAVEECETAMRVMLAAQMQLIAELERRGIPSAQDACSTKSWLQQFLRISGSEAAARVKVARAVEESVGPTGEPFPAELPETGVALRDGTIGLGHARTIVDGIRKVAAVLVHSV